MELSWQFLLSLYMLKKSFRLKNTAAFNATYNNHHIISDNYICIYFGKEKTEPDFCTRFAFVVSKKIHKRAVIRNRIKRLMRESIRLYLKDNKIDNLNKYISVILVAKPQAVNASFYTLNESVYKLFSSAL